MKQMDVSGLPVVPWQEVLRAYARFLVLQWRANRGLTSLRVLLSLVSAIMQPLQIFFFGMLVASITSGEDYRVLFYTLGSAITYGLQKLADNLIQSQLMDWGSVR